MLKRYPMRIFWFNLIIHFCVRIDPWLVRVTTEPTMNPAPLGYFSMPYLLLIYGGFVLVGLRIGYTTFRKEIRTKKEILLYTAITCFLMVLAQYIFFHNNSIKHLLIISMQEAIGFLLGGFLGLAKAKKIATNKLLQKVTLEGDLY